MEPGEGKHNNTTNNKIFQWLEKPGQKDIIEKRFLSTGKCVAKHKTDRGLESNVMVQHITTLPKMQERYKIFHLKPKGKKESKNGAFVGKII